MEVGGVPSNQSLGEPSRKAKFGEELTTPPAAKATGPRSSQAARANPKTRKTAVLSGSGYSQDRTATWWS